MIGALKAESKVRPLKSFDTKGKSNQINSWVLEQQNLLN